MVKWKSVFGIVIVNVLFFGIVVCCSIIDYSKDTVEYMKWCNEEEINNYLEDELDNFDGDPDGLYNNTEPYINGQINS